MAAPKWTDAARVEFDRWTQGATRLERYDAFSALWRVHCGGDVLQTCAEATAILVTLCPELKRVRGQVVMLAAPDGDTRPWPHWWTVTPEGEIVDPSADQFPSALEYTPIDESRGEPTSKCMNCGGLCYGGRSPCSDKCEREYADYLKLSVQRDRDEGW